MMPFPHYSVIFVRQNIQYWSYTVIHKGMPQNDALQHAVHEK